MLPSESVLAERLAVLRHRRGVAGAVFWALRKLTGVDVYLVLALELSKVRQHVGRDPGRGDHVRLICLASPADMEVCPASVRDVIDRHSGCGLSRALRDGGRVYALLRGTEVLSQLRINIAGMRVDTPTDLVVDVGASNAFLTFLHTPSAIRGAGWASSLIAAVCETLAREGLNHCVCHVQASNVRSVNAFRRAGWRSFACLVTTRSGRLPIVLRLRRSSAKFHATSFHATSAASAEEHPRSGG